MNNLEQAIEHCFAQGAAIVGNPYALSAFFSLRDQLEAGTLRAAEPDPTAPTGWRVIPGSNAASCSASASATSKTCPAPTPRPVRPHLRRQAHLPRAPLHSADQVRLVPGGSSVRAGAHVAKSVVIMPPAYINAGAFVGAGTMVDSHALVRLLRPDRRARPPLRLRPDRRRARARQRLSRHHRGRRPRRGQHRRLRGHHRPRPRCPRRRNHPHPRHPVYDATTGEILRATADLPLIIPAGAVVVPGSRAITHGAGKDLGLSVYTPIIVKYRDEKTDLSTTLEDLLR